MRAILGWLANRALLYVLLVAAIGAGLVLAPRLDTLSADVGRENLSYGALTAEVARLRDEGEAELAGRIAAVRTLGLEELDARRAQLLARRTAAEARLAAARAGVLAPYRPTRILAAKRAEIELALIVREVAAIDAARAPRAALEQARALLAARPLVPTKGAIAAANAACAAAGRARAAFEERWRIDQALREALAEERSRLDEAQAAACTRARTLAAQREAGLAAARTRARAEASLAALAADPLPEDFSADIARRTLADIAWQAFLALLAITLAPFAWRLLGWYVLAPLAERWPPMRFAPHAAPPHAAHPTAAPAAPSTVSLTLKLGAGEEALVRQDFLQSTSLGSAKRTRWLLDPAHPLTSLMSGMRFLTAIAGAGERVTVSAVRDPFAELAVLTLAPGSAAVVRPSALAALAQPQGAPTRITAHWRLFSLPAWLTWQLRYLAFHGPARLVLKGGRGVRIEPAERGRIVGPGQVIGFTTDLGYRVVRSETFWPYFLGREALLKDRIDESASGGVVLLEEAPLAGRKGVRRGIEGAFDALLRLGGM